jgi:prepilin-type processing-associated H-X9-DG protein
MSKVAEIGKALMMFAADNDDAFPTDEQMANRALDGYVADSTLLNGFVYSGVSGNLGAAVTQVGYMLCPGGRAVLFQDGHVTFVPDR